MKLSCNAGESVNWYKHYGKVVPAVAEHKYPLQPRTFTFRYITQKSEHIGALKNISRTFIAAMFLIIPN